MRNPVTAVGAYAKGGPLRLAVVVLAVLAVLACASAVWFGVAWFRAAGDESLDLAVTRDDVLRDAQQAAVNLTTLNYETVEADLNRWEASATGTLADEFRGNRATFARTIAEARTKTESRVPEAAVAEVDPQAGTARVLVAVDVTVNTFGQPPTDRRQRLEMQMVRTEQGWKAGAIKPVGAGAS